MKTLGTTVDGKYIVEMSPEEHYSFIELEVSINYSQYSILETRFPTIKGTELSPVFKALKDLADVKISIWKLREYVDTLSRIFGEDKK